MSKLVIKFDGILPPDELERISADFKNQLDRDGFIVIDNRFQVFEIERKE